ncbi:MAG: four helix bundle protein [Acidobacteria bacterium]|nr:four helix bundle protein [Acidobacteriota bacterium]
MLLSSAFGSQRKLCPLCLVEGKRFSCWLLVHYSKGSANEVRAHLATARGRHCITRTTYQEMNGRYEVIGKMLTRLIQCLRRTDCA